MVFVKFIKDEVGELEAIITIHLSEYIAFFKISFFMIINLKKKNKNNKIIIFSIIIFDFIKKLSFVKVLLDFILLFLILIIFYNNIN